jgi:hypothetical protein
MGLTADNLREGCGRAFTQASRSAGRSRLASTFVLVLPEISKPLGRKFAISNRMLDVLVAEIVLQRSSIHALIGQLEPS